MLDSYSDSYSDSSCDSYKRNKCHKKGSKGTRGAT